MTYPIVLAHGVCRFDILWNAALQADNNDDPAIDRLHYFKGVRTMLRQRGYRVCHASVSWAAGVEQRAEDLRRNLLQVLENCDAQRVNIIGHSMGGLDARHMLFNDRNEGKIHEHVASLTTISTPHHGSPFADWGIKNLPFALPLAQRLGLDLSALKDLRVSSCRAFNEDPEVRDFEAECGQTTLFRTYAGKQAFWGVFNPLRLPFTVIEKQEGENDGLVSVASAKWEERYFKGTLDRADHLNELGWWDSAQSWAGESPEELLGRVHDFYARIAQQLP